MGELLLNADKVGNLKVRDLVAFAELQGCELRIRFAPQRKVQRQAERTAKQLGQALRSAPIRT